jgi:dihydrofolate synthase / folylpolyglutamate synthase
VNDHPSALSPAVQAQLGRLSLLSPGGDTLGLARISELLRRLGDRQLRLPPVFHVAGTNGKGSTCAFLRAALEADGCRVHVYTSPHLVRFNERIRIAGRLIEDDHLATLLERVLAVADGIAPSFFEAATAAAFLVFAETPADACVIEVGLGGRLDATNVLEDPAACGIAQLGLDHQAFLGDTVAAIAREKAGIAKPGRPLVTFDYGEAVNAVVRAAAEHAGADLRVERLDWHFQAHVKSGEVIHRAAGAAASVTTPRPVLAGDHQVANLALAVAMLRAQDRISVSPEALKAAPLRAQWPARMQRLADGPLVRRLPTGSRVWLDGGHNPAAAGAVAATLAGQLDGGRAHLVLGMLENKDAAGLLAPFASVAESLIAVPIRAHTHHAPEALAALASRLGIPAAVATDVPSALDALARSDPKNVLILGSLYLAGEVLAANNELPQ